MPQSTRYELRKRNVTVVGDSATRVVIAGPPLIGLATALGAVKPVTWRLTVEMIFGVFFAVTMD